MLAGLWRAALLGSGAFALSALVAFLLADAVLLMASAANLDSNGEALRVGLSLASTVIIVGGAFAVLFFTASALARWANASMLGTLAVANVLAGVGLYWLLWYITIVNACGLGVSLPYPGSDACGR